MQQPTGSYFLGMVMATPDNEDQHSDEETARRMNSAVRRALNTSPTPTKELVGKTERAMARRESRVRKAPRSKPKSP
jgi:hypothetical protein